MLVALAFLPALASGVLLAHILWPERSLSALALKLFLGIGLGMGLRSLLYFLYLLILPGGHLYLYFDLLVLALITRIAIVMERRAGPAAWSLIAFPRLNRVQQVSLAVASLIVILSLASTASYLQRRRQGDWDAWMMYNRAARFIFKDQSNWLASFSPRMDPIFHADYPLLLASDVAAGWDILGRESAGVPMVQSALFSVACLGLFAAALAAIKSFGQAMLGITILWGLPIFVNEGARQMADVPLAFFILATAVLLAFYTLRPHVGLLALAGLTAGLGAWTKNEGAVLVVGAGLAVLVLIWHKRDWRMLIPFVAGVALPLVILISFRAFIAPSGDMLTAATGGRLSQVLDLSRHAQILKHMWGEILGFGAWGMPRLGLGIFPILFLCWLLLRDRQSSRSSAVAGVGIIILGAQVVGDYTAYLISPYELSWHLNYSSTRLVLQIVPLLALLVLATMLDPETVFARNARRSPE